MQTPSVFLLLTFLLTTSGLFAQSPTPQDDLFITVEQRPLYPGCADEADLQARKHCADRAMLEDVYTNITYPEGARNAGAQGMAVVSFIVEKDGRISDPRVARDPGHNLGATAKAVVQRWIDTDLRWEPGTQNGQPVRTQFNLPVKFKLDDSEAAAATATSTPKEPRPDEDGVYRNVEFMPLFPGCEKTAGQTHQDRKRCADNAMLRYVYTNVKYPEAAVKAKAEGIAVVSFIVEPDGSLSTPDIERNPGNGLGESALDVVYHMIEKDIRWEPGRNGDEAVRVRYLLPIKFKLSK